MAHSGSRRASLAAALLLMPALALAATPQQLLDGYAADARKADPTFHGFSAERGKQFFASTHGREWRCATCHTEDPRAGGRHASTQRPIKPLAPAANAARFNDPANVEKWFRRNCKDVAGRECTASEKGDVLAWLLTLH
jgi:hypothetical protein